MKRPSGSESTLSWSVTPCQLISSIVWRITVQWWSRTPYRCCMSYRTVTLRARYCGCFPKSRYKWWIMSECKHCTDFSDTFSKIIRLLILKNRHFCLVLVQITWLSLLRFKWPFCSKIHKCQVCTQYTSIQDVFTVLNGYVKHCNAALTSNDVKLWMQIGMTSQRRALVSTNSQIGCWIIKMSEETPQV